MQADYTRKHEQNVGYIASIVDSKKSWNVDAA